MNLKRTICLILALILMAACSRPVIKVTIKEMSVSLDKAILDSGPVTFEIMNSGAIDHQVLVIKTDATKLPDDPTKVMQVSEEGKVGGIDNIPHGTSAKLELDLTPGKYVVICNKTAHYGAGMYASFTVK